MLSHLFSKSYSEAVYYLAFVSAMIRLFEFGVNAYAKRYSYNCVIGLCVSNISSADLWANHIYSGFCILSYFSFSAGRNNRFYVDKDSNPCYLFEDILVDSSAMEFQVNFIG